jgi:hypothetical protein
MHQEGGDSLTSPPFQCPNILTNEAPRAVVIRHPFDDIHGAHMIATAAVEFGGSREGGGVLLTHPSSSTVSEEMCCCFPSRHETNFLLLTPSPQNTQL